MKVLDYDQAHEFVSKSKSAFWDGWDIVVWKRNQNGTTNPRGMFRDGAWGIANRFPVTETGVWRLPDKYAK